MTRRDRPCEDVGEGHIGKREQQEQKLWDGIKLKHSMGGTKACAPEVSR